ncbi:DEAD (Asp-Glu-Ala-Asp) box polypeptide 59 [Dissophora globulifera]|nr:DEAD (Asp-Glu-Ala-Asp) box polypeptide 59 [Dissophora globulifera]
MLPHIFNVSGARRDIDQTRRTSSKDDSGTLITFTATQRGFLDSEPPCAIRDQSEEYIGTMTDHTVHSLEHKGSDNGPLQNPGHETVDIGPSLPPDPSRSRDNTSASAATTLPRANHPSHRMVANITGYIESVSTAALSPQDIKNLREEHQIHVKGKHIPKPIISFDNCNLPSKMLSNLTENGYTQPRGVQMQVVPAGLCGRDMIISAETGAGKTAGFLIPVLTHAYGLSRLPGEALEGPFVLVLTPTRELAIQIEQVAKSMIKGMPNMRTALLVGGQAMASQLHRLKQNIQIAVATPGRIVDILTRHDVVSFSNVFCLVLDEVDLMFSLGFRKQVQRILEVLPEPPNGRQTLFCSATISKAIEQLADKKLHNALTIRIGDIKENASSECTPSTALSDVFSPSSKIKQTILWVENESKKKQLLSLLRDPTYFRPPVLVFVESRLGADLLANLIQVKCPGIKAVSMHGEKSQDERNETLKAITSGDIPVIVATGLLARGLDLKVATVINFDMAPSIQEYVHRVGRANAEAAAKAASGIRRGPRLGGMAWAITFINNDHYGILGQFANMLHGLGVERVTPLPSQLKQLVVTNPVQRQQSIVVQGPGTTAKTNPGTKKAAVSLSYKRKAEFSSQRQPAQHGEPSGQRSKKRKKKP